MSDFNYDVYFKQLGLRSLGFDPGPADGIDGPKTQAAFSKWLKTKQEPGPVDDVTLERQRWAAAAIAPAKASAVALVVSRILKSRARYEAVAAKAGVPWWVIAALHNMESDGDFSTHLHEGSPLTGRTRYVPKGRPLTGSPPFTWEESALDALAFDGLGKVNWSDLGEALYAAEAYNGTGYLRSHRDVPSPYLWAGTTIEKPGKYVSDGKWSATARSAQIGVAAIWKHLESLGAITLPI